MNSDRHTNTSKINFRNKKLIRWSKQIKFPGTKGLSAVMLWMNFNALALLAGFELNASIRNARGIKFEPMAI